MNRLAAIALACALCAGCARLDSFIYGSAPAPAEGYQFKTDIIPADAITELSLEALIAASLDGAGEGGRGRRVVLLDGVRHRLARCAGTDPFGPGGRVGPSGALVRRWKPTRG